MYVCMYGVHERERVCVCVCVCVCVLLKPHSKDSELNSRRTGRQASRRCQATKTIEKKAALVKVGTILFFLAIICNI